MQNARKAALSVPVNNYLRAFYMLQILTALNLASPFFFFFFLSTDYVFNSGAKERWGLEAKFELNEVGSFSPPRVLGSVSL